MQKINAAYEKIKNPEKAQQYGTYSQYDPFGGYQQRTYSQEDSVDNYQKAAMNYIRFGRYREAVNALNNATNRDARWYYLSALANDGIGNHVTALEHIRRAVSMDPSNQEYLNALNIMEQGGHAYRQQAGNFGGFNMRLDPCGSMLLCWLANIFCCGGRGMFCCI